MDTRKAMKANELRIGNLVYWNIPEKLNVPHKVVGVLENRLQTSPISLGDSMEDYLPIPLTPEWLTRFGFKHHKAGGFGGQDQWSGLDGWSINGGDWLFRGTAECLILVGYFNTQVKYVHSLQNLYFDLTGKELELKQ